MIILPSFNPNEIARLKKLIKENSFPFAKRYQGISWNSSSSRNNKKLVLSSSIDIDSMFNMPCKNDTSVDVVIELPKR